jgi:multicomponent Na+:H+ antiporter subunit C
MELFWSLVIGILFAGAMYSILRRSLAKILFGFLILSHAVNLLIFTAGGFNRGATPFIIGDSVDPAAISDPLPQALILTAIVIGFGVISFCIALYSVFYSSNRTDDVDKITNEEVA